MPRLSLRSRYSLILLVAAGVILTLGIVFRPKKQPSAQQLSESELFRLQQASEQRRLEDLSEFLSDAADRASIHLLYLKQAPWTAVVRDDKAVTSGVSGGVAAAVNGRGDVFELGRSVPLAGGLLQAFDIPPHDRPASPGAAATPDVSPGDWVLAVARSSERQPVFAQGLYQSAGPARCGDVAYTQVWSSVPLSEALVGGGLFTLDGDLLGVVVNCDGRPVTMDVQSVDQLLRRPVPLSERLLALYGMGVAEGAGVHVTAVWAGGAAARAGILPGDVIAMADNQPIASMADLSRLTEEAPRSDHSLDLFRGRRQVRVTLSSSTGAAVDAPGGLVLAFAKNSDAVVVQRAGGAAAAAGIHDGDVLAAVDGQQVSSPDEAAKLLSRAKRGPVSLRIRRNGAPAEVLIAAVEP